MQHERGVGQAGEDPEQERGVGRGVRRARRVAPGAPVGVPAHARVHLLHGGGDAVGLGARSEEDGLHDLRRPREPLERRGRAGRGGQEAGERHGVGRLEQQRPLPVQQPDGALLVHLPEHRLARREVTRLHGVDANAPTGGTRRG
jgi:hypothetical protein